MSSLANVKRLGDIVKYESPMQICREEYEVTRVLTAVEGLEVGRGMDFDAAVAAVQTIGCAMVADGGTYRLGFRGIWTAPIAWNANAAAIKTAFELISGGVVVTASAAFANATTLTFANTVGNIPEVVCDARLLTDGGLSMVGDVAITTTTVGELATMKMVAATTANIDSILLEPVSLEELQNDSGEALRRPFLVRGPAVVNATEVTAQCAAGTVADCITALAALGIDGREESAFTEEGTPRV